jgi:hypothetical protein
MIADLVDLDFRGAEPASSGWPNWISRDVSASEIEAIAGLCARLRSGESARAATGGERAFLHHVIAAADDSAYSRSFVLQGWLREPTDHSRAGRFLRSALHALFPSRAELEAASRLTGGRGRGLWLRFARPWALLVRALR